MDDENRVLEETDTTDPALEAIETELGDLQADVDHWIIQSEGYQPKNVMNFFQHKKQWLAILHDVAQKVSQLEPENQQRGANVLAAAYYHLGTACSWTEMWHYSYAILREGLPFVKQAGDRKALARYVREMDYYSNGPKMTLQMQACKTVAELEALLQTEDNIVTAVHRNTGSADARHTSAAAHKVRGTAMHKETTVAHEEKRDGHSCLPVLLGVIIFVVILWIL